MAHTIKAEEKPVQKILCADYIFKIPPYQRPYAWTTEQAGELLDDLLGAMGEHGVVSEESPYFLGSVVVIKDAERPEADVVDGQQRLTTITILLCVLRDLADDNLRPFIDQLVRQSGNPLLGMSDVFRLTPRPRDAKFFRETVQRNGGTDSLPRPEQFSDAQRRMVENAAHLRARVDKLSPATRQRLVTYLVQRCYLVVVAASDAESAFRIFSVMNSRGLDLTTADILKSELIGDLPDKDQDDYTRVWEELEERLGRELFAELFGHIRMIHAKQKQKGSLINEIRGAVPTLKTPAAFIDNELSQYAEAFEEISEQAFAGGHSARVNALLGHLSRLDNSDWQPPAIEAIARRREEPDFLLRFLADLERLAYMFFILRRDVNERIRRYARVLEGLQTKADLWRDESPLQLSAEEKSQLKRALDGPIYEMTRVRLPLLLRLDSALADGVAVYDHQIVSVEHVLPQNPAVGSMWITHFHDDDNRAHWTHRLANLVLLSRKKNAQASNYDFVQKKNGYFMARGGVANFALTNQVLAQPEWTPAVLEKRQKELIGKLVQTWRLV